MTEDETKPADGSGGDLTEAPGPADHGEQGGMATREQAPELARPERSGSKDDEKQS